MGNLVNSSRVGARFLQFSILNEEFLVSVIHQIALITSLPFVHTARRYYRLNVFVRPRDQLIVTWQQVTFGRELVQTWSFRGSKSRNKVSVGEPAEGSFTNDSISTHLCEPTLYIYWIVDQSKLACFHDLYFNPLWTKSVLTEWTLVVWSGSIARCLQLNITT